MPHGVAQEKRKGVRKAPWEVVAAKENTDKILNQILQPYACPVSSICIQYPVSSICPIQILVKSLSQYHMAASHNDIQAIGSSTDPATH